MLDRGPQGKKLTRTRRGYLLVPDRAERRAFTWPVRPAGKVELFREKKFATKKCRAAGLVVHGTCSVEGRALREKGVGGREHLVDLLGCALLPAPVPRKILPETTAIY